MRNICCVAVAVGMIGLFIFPLIAVIKALRIKIKQHRCKTCQWFGTSSGLDSVFRCYNPDSFRYNSHVCKPDYCKQWEKRS